MWESEKQGGVFARRIYRFEEDERDPGTGYLDTKTKI
jgi:hypothetical protein